jgi:hypothetical protein
MATASHAETDRKPSSAPSSSSSAAHEYAKPPAACSTVAAGTVKKLVPGAKTAGEELKLSDPDRRTGCSWNALKGFAYRWLDVTFEASKASDRAGEARSAKEVAEAAYERLKKDTAVPGLGDDASVGDELTKEDGQQLRQAVVVVRRANALITVTYNGSDFESGKAPDATEIREGAIKAAEDAVQALGTPAPGAGQAGQS